MRNPASFSYNTQSAMAAEDAASPSPSAASPPARSGSPQEEAARIAVDTVRAWLDANPKADMHVIFDVYTEKDEQTYREILGE